MSWNVKNRRDLLDEKNATKNGDWLGQPDKVICTPSLTEW